MSECPFETPVKVKLQEQTIQGHIDLYYVLDAGGNYVAMDCEHTIEVKK